MFIGQNETPCHGLGPHEKLVFSAMGIVAGKTDELLLFQALVSFRPSNDLLVVTIEAENVSDFSHKRLRPALVDAMADDAIDGGRPMNKKPVANDTGMTFQADILGRLHRSVHTAVTRGAFVLPFRRRMPVDGWR
jgi:hypothetical protein